MKKNLFEIIANSTLIRKSYIDKRISIKLLEDVVAYIISNLFFETIHENTPLFLACEFNSK